MPLQNLGIAPRKMIKKDRRWIWILLGIAAIALRYLAGFFPSLVETLYSRGVFQPIRYLLNSVISILPFPTLYLWILVAIVLLMIFFRNLFKNHKTWKARLYQFLLSVFALVGGVVFFFLLLWGYNYARLPFEDQLQLKPEPVSKEALLESLQFHTKVATDFRAMVPGQSELPFGKSHIPPNFESRIRQEIKRTMKELGYPTSGPIRARYLYKGHLLRIGTAGFYLPFTGECHVDPGLHPLQLPYVTAHEFAHGFGIGDEGTCNFIAYLTCTSSDDPFIRYSGHLSFWRSVASSYRSYDPKWYKTFRSNLPPGMIADLNAINENGLLYPDIFPNLRDKTYDAFLRAQGIQEGMKNYNRVIMLEQSWRTTKQTPFLK